ncbi:AAA family ATPase [Nannocystis sp.]|uniref:AAA family ATPase n=1 Tax=Nannocystis sp. TaxID=1962667 RepID=UPI0025D12747|nr:AAA family ATPase [Nannocystis sp.]MBK7823674.1 AAA family ATPase [Nannocystis sp.]
MLHALRLHDFRSFADSNRIELADVNVFIGPNSAGKSNIMTAIELALLSTGSPAPGPLAISQVPSFGSFDSILRRPGKNRKSADAEFSLIYEWDKFTARFALRRSPSSGSTIVHHADYSARLPPGTVEKIEAIDAEGSAYRSTDRGKKTAQVTFFGGAPVFFQRSGAVGSLIRAGEPPQETMIVRPQRPVPRSVYVLDDPMMHADDTRLISDLLRLWSDDANSVARATIVENLRTMKLAVDIDARPLGQRKGPRTAEIRVSPRRKTEAATLADVGYGVSQILPLLSHDAQLKRGNLIAYQPEAHLHPLAQSRLADVFVASADRGNKVYVETHSEHLVLRLQTLVAAGLDPARVRVFCVEHDGKQSVITTMSFDQHGVPKARWPRGFLDTGLDLARDLAEQRRRTP